MTPEEFNATLYEYALTAPIVCECRTKHQAIDPPILKVKHELDGLLFLKCLCGREVSTLCFSSKRVSDDWEPYFFG